MTLEEPNEITFPELQKSLALQRIIDTYFARLDRKYSRLRLRAAEVFPDVKNKKGYQRYQSLANILHTESDIHWKLIDLHDQVIFTPWKMFSML